MEFVGFCEYISVDFYQKKVPPERASVALTRFVVFCYRDIRVFGSCPGALYRIHSGFPSRLDDAY